MPGNVGFIGLGTIGEPMAAHLLDDGFSLTICAHRNMEPVERLRSKGASVAANPREVAAASDIIVTCVPDAPQVEEVCLGEHGIVHGAASGAIVIDCSTIAPTASQRIAAALHEQAGIAMLDAPISGGPERAAKGELAIMVGGAPEIFERAQPVLNSLGRSITHVGASGMGEVVKLANNLIAANIMVAVSEAMTMAVKAGADAAVVREVLMQSAASNFILGTWVEGRMLKDNYDPGFATSLMQKDLGAALETARAMEVPMMLTALSYQLYELAEGAGYGREDYCAISKIYQDAADITIATGQPRKSASSE
jgi:3-hydroxyisobutyrate dehydrogenase-like beta-hydroxyacid dehydrogenase